MMEENGSTLDSAIQIDYLRKGYGSHAVINDLSLRVPLGKIYGLLGPSGCGKTTLLKCVVGRLRPDSGIIRVMGQRPGKLGHKVPGKLIGYMPQDLALYQEFTISETLFYFGRIFGMESEDIQARVDFLVELLKLPTKAKLICRLSGGQQRRVSFACALLHEPPLLILDEPTVGVDPLLRQCIWDHLKTIVSSAQKPTSVVITTHYIEEAREGHMVALMRDGRLLAESSPDSLLSFYKETSLEAVFLKLCHRDHSADDASSLQRLNSEPASLSPAQSTSEVVNGGKTGENAVPSVSEKAATVSESQDNPSEPVAYVESISFSESLRTFVNPPSPRRIGAVVVKDFTNMRRRIGFLLFEFSLPVVQIVLFCLCIGGDPAGLRLAIVNHDATGALSKEFLAALDTDKIKKVPFSDLDEAKAEVRRAAAWGVLHLEKNFTLSMIERLTKVNNVTEEKLRQSSVHMFMDDSNYQVSAVLRQSVLNAFEKVIGDLMEARKMHRKLAKVPIEYHAPLLGNKDATFTEFMAPGIIITILFFLSTGLTAVTFVVQRKEGLLDRSLVAGVTVLELMLGHMLTELFIMSGQTGLLLVFSLAVFSIRCTGSVALVILLALTSGFCGMSLGLLISVLCAAENAAMQAALGTMYPCLLLSGIMWPSEAMPTVLWYISRAMPTTMSVEAMRSVISRGFGLGATSVWLGFLSPIFWSLFLLLTAMLLIKFKGI